MKILAFDTSSRDIYVSLIVDGKAWTKKYIDTPSTEYLLPKIDQLLRENKLKINDIDVISVGIGPGSFTGSRVAIVTAKGFLSAFPDMKAVMVNSFDAVCNNLNSDDMIVVEGFSDFVYVLFDGKCACMEKPEAIKLAKKAKNVYGLSNYLEVSNFVEMEYDIVSATLSHVEDKKFVKAHDLEPLYLRASQAEIQLNERKKNVH